MISPPRPATTTAPVRACPECHGTAIRRVTAVPGLEPAPVPPEPPAFPLPRVAAAGAVAAGALWVAVSFWRHGRGHSLAQAVLMCALGVVIASVGMWQEKQHRLGGARKSWEAAMKAWKVAVWYCEPCDRVFRLGGPPREKEHAWAVAEDAAIQRPKVESGPGGRLAVDR